MRKRNLVINSAQITPTHYALNRVWENPGMSLGMHAALSSYQRRNAALGGHHVMIHVWHAEPWFQQTLHIEYTTVCGLCFAMYFLWIKHQVIQWLLRLLTPYALAYVTWKFRSLIFPSPNLRGNHPSVQPCLRNSCKCRATSGAQPWELGHVLFGYKNFQVDSN